jgi:UDP-N-acetyl-D-mannosaminuronic acid transferase (WecB/TagA/CpsF family)
MATIRTILGISFFAGSTAEVVEKMVVEKGLLLAPAAPALLSMQTISAYRDALLGADTVIADSGFMVLLWNALERDAVPRISGLRYLRALLNRKEIRQPGKTLWVMAGPDSARRNLEWLATAGIAVPNQCVYLAPMYRPDINDPILLEKIGTVRPDHIIVTIGGMTQERLGFYLKKNLNYRPGIHCIGAAIAFLSGDQVKIPDWADRLYLGWLFRVWSNPRLYAPRYWQAVRLTTLLLRYRSNLPPFLG